MTIPMLTDASDYLAPDKTNIQTQFILKLSSIHIGILDLVPVYYTDPNKLNMLGLQECLVSRINIPSEFRGQGHGTTLLNSCLQYADDNKLVLLIEVSSSGDMTNTQLSNWYRKFGFVDSEGLLVRLPAN
jgi:GNAT superfamily N-acetyltransferase